MKLKTRKTKQYTYFVEEEKGGVCWMTGGKKVKKDMMHFFNIPGVLRVRHTNPPGVPPGAFCKPPGLEADQAETRPSGILPGAD